MLHIREMLIFRNAFSPSEPPFGGPPPSSEGGKAASPLER